MRRRPSRTAAWLLAAGTVLSLDLVMMPPLPTLVLGAAVVSGFLQAREA